jgi:hypothetical protein
MSLHRILTLFVIAMAVLASGAAVSLVLLTTYLHRTTVELETALESVRVAEEMQIDLRVNSRSLLPSLMIFASHRLLEVERTTLSAPSRRLRAICLMSRPPLLCQGGEFARRPDSRSL